MAEDVGILISEPGTNVFGAPANRILMNTARPFIKIDTQKPTSFQNILLIINTNPPEPVGPAWASTYTIIHKFKHTYTYTPAIETLFYLVSPPPGAVFSQTYFLDSGVIGLHTADDSVTLYATADATWVYFIIRKDNDGLGSANLLTGTNVQVGIHVFADDVGV